MAKQKGFKTDKSCEIFNVEGGGYSYIFDVIGDEQEKTTVFLDKGDKVVIVRAYDVGEIDV